MRYAIVENGAVINMAEANAPLAGNWIQSDAAAIGDLYADGLFTKPLPDTSAAAAGMRAERDNLLSECDWVIVMSLEAGRAIPAEWATYRQALRDLPQQAGFPVTIVWPVKP